MKILIGWIPAFMASIALASSCYGTFFCDSIVFRPDPDILQQDGTTPYPSLYFGPWYQQETVVDQVSTGGETKIFVREICVKISSSVDIDPKWKTNRAFGILTVIIGFIALFPLYFYPCYGTTEDSWRVLAILLSSIVTLFQGMAFLWLMDGSACDPYTPLFGQSDNTQGQDELFQTVYSNGCELDSGTAASITATVLFFATGIVMLGMGAPKREQPQPPQTQEVVYERTLNPDGTYTTQEVNVVKGHAVQN